MPWHHIDLFSHKLLGRELPLPVLIFMDTLGFLGFLAILITNGIISSNYGNVRWGKIKPLPALMIYNSVPWLVCWCVSSRSPMSLSRSISRPEQADLKSPSSIHLIIVHRDMLENIKKLFGSSHQGNGCSQCTHCRSQWSAQTRKPAAGAVYSLLSPQEQYDEDAEANRGSVSVEETRQTEENTPLTAAAAAAGDSA